MFYIFTSWDRFSIADVAHLISQLPKPFIINDFNSPRNVWGCRDTDQRGRIIEDVINRNNLLLYINKSYTYLHPGTGAYSALNLALADASIFLDYSCKVHDDNCGSDHFPILLENSGSELDDKIPRWNLKRAKWDEFKNSCILKLISDANDTDDDNITLFSKTLLPRKVSLKHLQIKDIISHGSTMIVKLLSDHARQLYGNLIFSLVLNI